MPRFRRSLFPSGLILAALSLGAFAAAVLWDGAPPGRAVELPGAAAQDREVARFASCAQGSRQACVVDGDTIWYRGAKIRLADINTPETGEPGCAREAELGAAATARLTDLLNAGPFTLAPADRDRDRYGRALRVVSRGGESLGDTLAAEGLAEPWRGHRGDWCGPRQG
jgi:endonuclease YncB( thermonuclease family)